MYKRYSMTVMQKLRRNGNSYIVTIPRSEVERLNLRVGQMVAVQVQPLDVRPVLSPDLREAFEEEFRTSEAALRHLATH
jgi:antitoxin component of MazEF toxin-antitoxin module